MRENELTIPNYWMNFLEDNLFQATDGHMKLASYAIGTQVS